HATDPADGGHEPASGAAWRTHAGARVVFRARRHTRGARRPIQADRAPGRALEAVRHGARSHRARRPGQPAPAARRIHGEAVGCVGRGESGHPVAEELSRQLSTRRLAGIQPHFTRYRRPLHAPFTPPLRACAHLTHIPCARMESIMNKGILVAPLAALLLAACGGDDNDDENGAATLVVTRTLAKGDATGAGGGTVAETGTDS